MRALWVAIALVWLAACSGGSQVMVVDGSSKEAAEKSIADMTAALPDDKKPEFAAALATGLRLSEIAGKTADDIIAVGRAKKIELVKAKIGELESKLPAAEKAIQDAKAGSTVSKRFLSAISLINPQLVWRVTDSGTPAPLLSFNMKNGTSEAIQTIVFEARIGPKAGGRPWIDQRFQFKFAEPVTTGESKFVFVNPDLTLAGNADALQSKDKSASDYRYGIDFVRVVDLDGRVIMDDEATPKAEAALQAAKDAVAAARAELKRLEEGGPIAA